MLVCDAAVTPAAAVGAMQSGFDAVLAADNALPHFLDDRDLQQDAAIAIASKPRPGGLFPATTRDYDAALQEHPTVQHPAYHQPIVLARLE